MERDLVDAYGREVGLEALPVLATIEREEDPRLGAEVEHVAVLLIFGDGACDFWTEVVDGRGKRFAEIGADPDVRGVVVEAVVVDGDVHRARIERRGHHAADVAPRGEARKILSDVLPRLATVARHAEHAVVGAGVEHAGLFLAFANRDDRRVADNPVVLADGNVGALEPHRHDGVAIGVGGEVWADDRPRVAAIGALEEAIARHIEHARIAGREHNRGVPHEAIRLVLRRRRAHVERIRADRLGLAGHLVAADDVAVLRFGIHDARVPEILHGFKAIAALNLEELVVVDPLLRARLRGSAPVVVVLHAAAHVVRALHVEAHMVEQTDGHVRVENPGLRAVVRDAESAVATDQHMIGVRGVEPDRVDVVVNHERGVGGECFAAVDRELHLHAAHVHPLGVLGINTHLREVHRARVGTARLGPRGTAVIGAEQAVRVGSAFDRGVHRVHIPAEHIDRNTAERTTREAAAGDLGPRVAAIDRLEERAAGSTAIHAAGRATTLVHGRIERLGVSERLREIISARVLIALEHELPALAAIGRLVDATVTTGAKERARRSNECDVVVAGIENNAIDVLGVLESHIGKRLAAIGGLPHAVAPAGGLAIVRLTGADPNDVRVGLRHGDVADAEQSAILKQWREGRAITGGLPHATVRGSDIPNRRIRLVDGKIGDASRHDGGSNRPEVKLIELLGYRCALRAERCSDEGECRGEAQPSARCWDVHE